VLETPAEADGRPRFHEGKTNLNKHAHRGICPFRSSRPKSEAISLELEGGSPPPNCSRTSTQRVLHSSR
jgi:hypothetical protein